MCVTVRTYYPFHVSFCYRKNIVSTVLGPVCIFFSFVSQFSYEVIAHCGPSTAPWAALPRFYLFFFASFYVCLLV